MFFSPLCQDLKREIENNLQEYEATQAEVDKWIAYRDSGRQEHSIQIKLLTEELVDCQQNFEEMKSNLPFIRSALIINPG